jgi:Ice-binding-like
MNNFENVTRPLTWSMALLLAALVAGCGDGSLDPILGDSPAGAGVVTDTGPVALGAASTFGIAATAGVTNTVTAPVTHIEGNVILSPLDQCNAVTVDNAGGFGLCAGTPPTINGLVITDSYPDLGITSAAVKAAMNAAFLSVTPPAGPPAAGSLGGATNLPAGTTLGDVAGSPYVLNDNYFLPGVYQSLTSILITGDLTLDAQGDSNAAFYFQSSSTVGMAAGAAPPGVRSRILLINGARASRVYWQAASDATLGLYSEFQGNILAANSITMLTGATSCGRLYAGAWVGGSGAFVFDSNVVSVPGRSFAPPATYSTTCQ